MRPSTYFSYILLGIVGSSLIADVMLVTSNPAPQQQRQHPLRKIKKRPQVTGINQQHPTSSIQFSAESRNDDYSNRNKEESTHQMSSAEPSQLSLIIRNDETKPLTRPSQENKFLRNNPDYSSEFDEDDQSSASTPNHLRNEPKHGYDDEPLYYPNNNYGSNYNNHYPEPFYQQFYVKKELGIVSKVLLIGFLLPLVIFLSLALLHFLFHTARHYYRHFYHFNGTYYDNNGTYFQHPHPYGWFKRDGFFPGKTVVSNLVVTNPQPLQQQQQSSSSSNSNNNNNDNNLLAAILASNMNNDGDHHHHRYPFFFFNTSTSGRALNQQPIPNITLLN